MDPIDDFSFKPITEGLGFHKKKKDSSAAQRNAIKENEEISSNKVKSHNSIKSKNESISLKSPLPKKEILPTPKVESNTNEVIDELVRNFKKTKNIGTNLPPTTNEDSVGPQVIIKPISPQIDEEAFPLPWMMSPFLIDAMLVMALILSALMSVLLITKIDLLMMLVQNSSDIGLWLTFPAIGLGMIFTYMSLTRIFLGCSLGEMIFDIQLGTSEQREHFSYYFLVMARVGIAILTGFVILPMASLIMRKDYLGKLSGLRLYRRKK